MSATVSTAPFQSIAPRNAGTRVIIASVLAVWFFAVIVLGATGALANQPGSPPLPIAIGFAAPIVLFFIALRLSPAFKELVLSADLRLIAGIQAWRFAGLGFLALYAHNILPGGFALPAGLGDMAIGLTAPWVAGALTRQPNFAASMGFRVWNYLGLLDLVVAISDGALNSVLATGAAGQVNTGAMTGLPLALIPIYLVPIFFMLHVTSLLQSRRAALTPSVQTPAH
jgi:hypothetical protein